MRHSATYFALLVVLTWVESATAAFHLWGINEVYSSADGSVQFIEFFTSSNSQQFTNGREIRTNAPPTFVFPDNTPSPTRNHHLLLATTGFGLMPGSVTPDFTIPDNFFDPLGDTINFVGADSKTFASLPTDGINSFNYPGATIEVNSPTNYAGQAGSIVPEPPAPPLQAGDADQDLDFDQLDLVQVQIAAKYLTGQAATWGEGDWNGAPGGSPGNPPTGDGVFNQFDIIAAQIAAIYLSGPYAAVQPGGVEGDGQTSVVYNPNTGELAVDAPAGVELTSINIDSAAGFFTGESAQNLGGSFDNDADNNIFKATFGSSFGSLSFGNVAQPGLSEDFVLNDLTVVGSLAGGGDLGNVDLIYVPEPSTLVLLTLGLLGLVACRRRRVRSV